MSEHPPEAPSPSPQMIFMTMGILVEGGMIVLAVLIGLLMETPPLKMFGGGAMDVLISFGLLIPMLIFFYVSWKYDFKVFESIRVVIRKHLLPMIKTCSVSQLAIISLLAGLGEEMLFRGVIQAGLMNWLPFWAALLLASLAFGIAHSISKAYFVVATGIGLYLGLAFEMSGQNLTIPVLCHAIYDFLALVWLQYTEPVPDDLTPE